MTKLDVDALAQEIRRVDGSHSLGAGALAEALMPFLSQPPAVDEVTIGRAMGAHIRALKAGKLPSEAWRAALTAALHQGERHEQ